MKRALILILMLLCAGMTAMAEETAQYYGTIGKRMKVYGASSEKSAVLGTLEADTVVDVYQKLRTWTIIDYEGQKGYVLTKFIEQVQRKDPFQGPMPGTSKHVAVGHVLKDISFLPEGYKNSVHVSQGSWLSIEQIKEGRAYFPYRKEEENVSVKTDSLKIYDFVSWEEAQPGDLIYAFTTFYPTSEKKKGNAGRMYNIGLAAQRLTHIRIESGGTFSFNTVCGPYTEENGYREAPILSGTSSMGFGGGVCQVCSTIYNIVLRIPMVIEEMHWHSQGGVSYLPSGFDATVGSKSDLVVRNVLPYPLRLELEVCNGVMTAFMFRAEDDGTSSALGGFPQETEASESEAGI